MISRIATVFTSVPVLVVTDSWFGNAGLLKPLRGAIGEQAHLLSRLRVNAVLHGLPVADETHKRRGRPRKYGLRLGSVAELSARFRALAVSYQVPLYGRVREVSAYDQVVMLKSLRCQVRVVWVFRKNQAFALVTTDLTLSVEQIIEYYGARWKIEAAFKEIKQEIGSASSQNRSANAVTNHLEFCMLASTIVWLYAERLNKAPARRYASQNRTEYAFADVRRTMANEIGHQDFVIGCPKSGKPPRNSLLQSFMRLVA